MNKARKLLFTTLLGFLLIGCSNNKTQENDGSILIPKTNVNVPNFEFTINDFKVSSSLVKDLKVYEYSVKSTNSEGNTSTTKYVGYKLVDIAKIGNVETSTNYVIATSYDGYQVVYDKPSSVNTMMAFNKNDKDVENYPIFAPCDSLVSGDYIKGCSSIVFTNDAPSNKTPDNQNELAEPTIKKKNDIKFSSFSFKINGQDVTNETLETLDKYKTTVQVQKKTGGISDKSYTGFLLKNVLNLLNVSTEKIRVIDIDQHETIIEKEIIEDDLTILAIECDKTVGENGTIWIAPCRSHNSSDYIKLVVELKSI